MGKWKIDEETIEICVCYFINKGIILFDEKWNHIENIKSENSKEE